MPVEIQWHDIDPGSGERRRLRAEKFASQWRFHWRLRRYERWQPLEPTREMWEHVLDSLKRRYRRREGVSDADVAYVERILAAWPAVRDEEE